ncbi:ELWxxDGT repeat protein [Archangium lipolyticum]|uniref:ELWxxDGT repeat protein n=1 Tax=Archangium lipolyticum TaxID=2970465 RepID=UPI00214A7865|nr:ELWxxDGT repeat protein [Archangium lipolyticum]
MRSNHWVWGGLVASVWLMGCPSTDGHGGNPEPSSDSGTGPAPFLIKDINETIPQAAMPRQVVTAGGTTFFTATDATSGTELWRTDGTAEGTQLVKDLLPGPLSSSPFSLTDRAGTLFFFAQSILGSHTLWRSDGTPAGTEPVKDSLDPSSGLEQFGERLYFRSNDGHVLWESDGTPEGTRKALTFIGYQSEGSYWETKLNRLAGSVNGTLFLDVQRNTRSGTGSRSARELWLRADDGMTTEAWLILPPSTPSSTSGSDFAVVGDALFYRGLSDDGTIGLWRTDGTRAGTVRVRDVEPVALAAVGGTLFFRVDAGASGGTELWKSDGTEAGTVRVTTFPQSARPSELTAVGGTLFFRLDEGASGGAELWRSDGTEAGTVRVRAFPAGAFPSELTAMGGTLFFRLDEGASSGAEPWKSDGTEVGTVRLKDLEPGTTGSGPSGFEDAGGTLFFTAQTGASGPGVWKSDGTEAGTVLVRAFPWPTGDAFEAASTTPPPSAMLNGTLFFTARDETTGLALWKSDGTEAGTERVLDLSSGASFSSMLATERMLFFTTSIPGIPGTASLWKSDGTETGTAPVDSLAPALMGTSTSWSRVMDGIVVFQSSGRSSGRTELWRTDGTQEGTVLLTSRNLAMQPLASLDGVLLLTAPNSDNALELWRTDGTAEGTFQVKSFSHGARILVHSRRAGDEGLLFIVHDRASGPMLWRTDGTEAGTVLVKGFPMPGSEPTVVGGLMADVDGTVLFVLRGQNFDSVLWRTDGTEAGTVPLKAIWPGAPQQGQGQFTTSGGRLYFWTGTWDFNLWTSDGTEEGTVLLKGFDSGTPTYEPFVVMDGKVFFSASEGEAGRELWSTDGTEAGTRRVKDLAPGVAGSAVVPMSTWKGRLVLRATLPDNPRMPVLWISDGTEAGTVPLRKDDMGRMPYNPYAIFQVGSRLLFRATTPTTGYELWGLELPDPSPEDSSG